MRRLFLQIYLGFVGVLFAFALAAGLLWWWTVDPQVEQPIVRALAERLAAELPAAGASPPELRAVLREQSQDFGLNLVVWDRDGNVLASVGPARELPRRRPHHASRREFKLVLDDGRELGLSLRRRHRSHGAALVWLGALGGAIAVGAYPVARRITRRLERLRGAVDELGGGDLTARVRVEGRDEVADLARTFNEAAGRIEGLVDAQRRLLASASHELRSPLARLRMAVELMASEGGAAHLGEAEADIAELDELIEDLLTAARLQSGGAALARERVDLLGLLAEEGARSGVEAAGESLAVTGDTRLLRRMIRNLLENAQRHGRGGAIEASVEALDPGRARLVVADRGPGVPDHEQERIFEPFYRPAGHSEGGDGGVGLGLALVREIARHHGGDARCLARAGGGTRFEVDLPVTGAAPAA